MLLVFICFFLSGLTGLTYEILWSRMIVKIIGGAPFAVSIILTVFMGGLGVGSYVAGRMIDRVKNPVNLVRIYGALELIIAAYGLALPLLLRAYGPVQELLYNRMFDQFMLYNLLTFLGCAAILLIPVICMGATLPILCRFCVKNLSHLGTRAGRLYGINTLGAAVGSFLCGFWLIAVLGVWGTLAFAVVVNAVIGIVCLTRRDSSNDRGGSTPPDEPEEEANPAFSRGQVAAALAVFGISGFCSIAYEVIWTRLLGLLVGPTTYSFTIILVTFITGLAIGSVVFGRLADRTKDCLRLLIVTQIVAALLVLAVSQVIGNGQMFFAKLIHTFQHSFGLLSMVNAGVLFVFMILPTVCLGATFPLVGKIYTRSVARVGRSIGVAYTINTTGAVLGSFCAGFVIIPLVGKETGLSLVAGIQLLAALTISVLMAAALRKKEGARSWGPLAFLAVIGLVICVRVPAWNHLLLSLGKYHQQQKIESLLRYHGWTQSLFRGSDIMAGIDRSELVYYGEGIGGFTAVRKHTDPLGNVEYVMTNSGKSDASSRGDMKTQTMSAHIPMLFHRNARTVMVLGLASGITVGEVLHYPVDRVDVIDISRKVVEGSEFFRPWNNDLLSNPRTKLIIQDGRAHLQLAPDLYDVVISEPSNPWMAGLAALFTRNFFELVESRLGDDGIFAQWLQAYQMDWETFALIGRTFAEVFPRSLLVCTNPSGRGGDYLLIGFKGASGPSLENVRAHLPHLRKSGNVVLTDARCLYRLILSEDLRELFGPGHVNTDSRPRLEYRAPKLMYDNRIEDIRTQIGIRERLSDAVRETARQAVEDVDAQIAFAAFALSLHRPFTGMVDVPKATPEQKQRYLALLDGYCAENAIDCATFRSNDLRKRCRAAQKKAVLKKIDRVPNRAVSYFYLAELARAEGNLDDTITYCRKALEANDRYALAHHNLAVALSLKGDTDRAVVHFVMAITLRPDIADAHGALGSTLMRQGNLKDAARHLQEALRLMPGLPAAERDLQEARRRMRR